MTIFLTLSNEPVPISNWYDEVLPLIPGVTPGAFLSNAIIRGAIELCTKGRVWEMDHPSVNLEANKMTYSFALGVNLKVVEPLSVMVNGREIDPGSPDEFDALMPDWRTEPRSDARWYYCPDEDSISIVPMPSSDMDDALTMRVAVKPASTSTTIAERFWSHLDYRDAITNATLAYLYGINGVPWGNKGESLVRLTSFNQAVGRFDALRAKGRTRKPLRTSVVHGVK